MASKSMLIAIGALILVTWVLVSSITTIPQISPGTNGSGSTGTPGHPGNPGSISSNGTGFSSPVSTTSSFNNKFLLGNLSFPSFNIPSFPLNLSFFNFSLPLIHFHLPFHLPSFGSFFGFLFPSNSSGSNSSGSNGGNKGGSTGKTSGNTPSSTFSLPPIITYILIAVMVALVAILGVMSVAKYRRKGSGSQAETFPEEIFIVPDAAAKQEDATPGATYSVEAFSGWHTGNDLILPDIPEDLPLVYPEGMPLSLRLRSQTDLHSDSSSLEREGDGSYTSRLKDGCNLFSAAYGDENDEKLIRGVDLRNEFSLLLRINLFGGMSRDVSANTVREIFSMDEVGSVVRNRQVLENILNMYERSYYGLKSGSIADLQNFLYGIRDSFVQPRIARCRR